MNNKPTQTNDPDAGYTTTQKLLWGMFWGLVIGGSWLAADILRPIYNALVWGN